MKASYDIVICGAGIAGVSTAYHLAVKFGVKNILLIDERPPLSLTSDKSSECYRNWWSGPDNAMVSLMNRSIDLMESLANDSGNIINLNRRGYLYFTGDEEKIPTIISSSKKISSFGAGRFRIVDDEQKQRLYQRSLEGGSEDQISGADLILDRKFIQKFFPFVTEKNVAALHVRRAGWFSAQQLGMYMLNEARKHGVHFFQASVASVQVGNNRIQNINLDNKKSVKTDTIINAAGPFLKDIGKMAGYELPVFCELHMKIAINDFLDILPRDAPLLIWNDPQRIRWTSDEQEMLREDEDLNWLLGKFPPGVHTRPEGGMDSQMVIMLWEYNQKRINPVFPLSFNPLYTDLVLRGLTTMVPGFSAYIDKGKRPILDGGYYTKTIDNRPIISSMPVKGAFVIGALSGFGMMASCASGELMAAHVTESDLPVYADAFHISRFDDPLYQEHIREKDTFGQL
jgi:glycine/D-amino acid oxidase-like deaminating enzyme